MWQRDSPFVTRTYAQPGKIKKRGERFCDVRRVLLFVGFFNLVDGPGGSEASGGVAADAHGDFVALAGLRVAQGEDCAVSRGLDGAAFAGDPVVLADDAEGCRRRRGDRSTAGAATGRGRRPRLRNRRGSPRGWSVLRVPKPVPVREFGHRQVRMRTR